MEGAQAVSGRCPRVAACRLRVRRSRRAARQDSNVRPSDSQDGGGGAAITARHYNLYVYADEKRDALNRWAARLEQLLELPLADENAPQAAA